MVSVAQGIQEFIGAPETWGYTASSLVLATFCMKRMVPLRIVAICSNFAFITYGASLHLVPIVVLHSLLVPINLRRLSERCNLGPTSWRPFARRALSLRMSGDFSREATPHEPNVCTRRARAPELNAG